MSKKKKKVIVTTSTTPAKKRSQAMSPPKEMTFGKENFKWLGIGIALIVVGMLLMIGGFNENPNIWDESKIYGFQRTVLAPIVILSGLVVNIYALFK
ncbi:MAG: DUF3098 domain-containing protein [Saprospiraceae bacterium]|nr:DUF3098 domain-containing protein [Bacteroidia bacterium]NNE15545.1 DUF3098 domain-containing protein [Saprospiraceae bacterium]NNL92560.1 DUF3098 domain-containing protein [Saprospiraceae bacterium]